MAAKAAEAKLDLGRLDDIRPFEAGDVIESINGTAPLSVPDLGVYNRLLPEKWGVRILGGEGEVAGGLVLSPAPSGLPPGQTLGNFDWSFQPNIERSRIETLATCQWIRENRTLLIQGPPGVGKSQMVAQVAEKHGMPVIDIRLSQMEPSDLRGIPFRVDGEVEWAIPSMLPNAERHGNQGILFLDEITSVPPSVSASRSSPSRRKSTRMLATSRGCTR